MGFRYVYCVFILHNMSYAFMYRLPPPHTDAFFMRCFAIRHDASTYMHGRIVTDRNATHEKRIRVGRAFTLRCAGQRSSCPNVSCLLTFIPCCFLVSALPRCLRYRASMSTCLQIVSPCLATASHPVSSMFWVQYPGQDSE